MATWGTVDPKLGLVVEDQSHDEEDTFCKGDGQNSHGYDGPECAGITAYGF
jgi:hypothetical protein